MWTRVATGCAVGLLLAGCAAAPAETGPRIILDPDAASITEPVRVLVDGLALGDQVRVWARTTDRLGHQWESSGEFTANGIGQVDVSTTPSTGGSYQGVDPNGLFWSMQLPADLPVPYPLVGADDMIVQLGVDRGDATLTQTTLRRVVREPAGQVLPIAEAGLVGDLYLPPGEGPWPGVLLLGGAEGNRPDPAYAALLAANGYAVLGLAYFGEPGLPSTLSRVPVEYGLTAARWLAERPDVTGPQVGVVGTDKGAEYGLLLAATEPDRFGAVVAHSPSDVVWPALDFDPTTPEVSSWTRGGRDVPYLSWAAGDSPDQTPEIGQPVVLSTAYAAAEDAASSAELARARIDVENIKAPVLLTSAGQDGVWPSAEQAQRVLDTITEAGNPYGAQRLDFPAAGHLIGTIPGLPTSRAAVQSGKVVLETGGDPAATAEATRNSFPATLAVLNGLHRAS